MSSQVIELRQASADKVNENGDYIVNLPFNKRLTINEGDVVQVKNTFIDTEASTSQKISIDEEMTINFSVAKYYIYARNDYLQLADGSALPADTQPDYDYYTLCEENGGGNPNLFLVTKLKDVHFGGENSIITAQFTDQNGDQQTKQYPATPVTSVEYVATCHFIYDNTKPITLTSNQDGIVSILDQEPATASHLLPVEDTITITIEAGNYSATDLANTLNDKLAIGGTSGGQDQRGASKLFTAYTGTPLPLYLVKWDGSKAIKLNTGSNETGLLLGASQIEFDYIQDTNQFSINYSYTPFFAGGSEAQNKVYQPSVGFLSTQPSIGNYEAITINKYSGVYFTNVSSTYASGASVNFFSEILDFDLNKNIVAFGTLKNQTYDGVTFNSVPVNTTRPVDGIETTGGFIGLDNYIDKSKDNWYSISLNDPNSLFSTSTNSFPILAGQKNIANVPYGYYLIEVKSSYTTDFFSKDNNLDIGAIVSRYYATDSYTSGSSLDSVPYIHKGQPVALNSFRIRILTPDKVVVKNLGEGSAVYLQITKTN